VSGTRRILIFKRMAMGSGMLEYRFNNGGRLEEPARNKTRQVIGYFGEGALTEAATLDILSA